jgi:hypothetical protein
MRLQDLIKEDVDGDIDLSNLDKWRAKEALQGNCEDSHEETAPYIGMCPDETMGEKVSPLRFGRDPISAYTWDQDNRARNRSLNRF